MGFDTKLNKTDRKIQEKIREKGGVANIDNPLQDLIVPLAEERMYSETKTAVRRLRDDHKRGNNTDWLDRTPVRQPQRKTIGNIAERLVFEELVKEGVKQYRIFTGQKISYDLETIEQTE